MSAMGNQNDDLIIHGNELNIESCTQNVGQYFLNHMKLNKDRIVQIDPVNNIMQTHGELRKLSIQCAIEMKRLGVKKHDVITICGENRINLIVPWLAAMYLGAVTNPLHPLFPYDEIERMLELTQPSMIFCDEKIELSIKKITQDTLKQTCKIVVFERDFLSFIDTSNYDETIENNFQAETVDVENDLALIVCSSGTTGAIKGVTIRHSAYFIAINTFMDTIKLDDRILIYSPLSWVTALWTYGMIFFKGATRIVLEYDVNKNLEVMSKYKVNWILFTPLKLTEMVRHPSFMQYPEIVRNLKLAMFTGSAATQEQILEYREKLKNTFLWNGYGTSEMIFCVAYFDLEKDVELNIKKINSHGKPNPGVHWKVIDPETEKILKRNEVGELCLKGLTLTKGYYKDLESTQAAIDKDGWFHSGDMARVDEDDCLFITGRYKELLKYKGWQVTPSEIEKVIKTHPGVADACVVGKPHEIHGDLPLAIVIKRENYQNLTEKELASFVNDRVADIQKLRGGVIFTESFPLTPSGKIRRIELRKLIPKN